MGTAPNTTKSTAQTFSDLFADASPLALGTRVLTPADAFGNRRVGTVTANFCDLDNPQLPFFATVEFDSWPQTPQRVLTSCLQVV